MKSHYTLRLSSMFLGLFFVLGVVVIAPAAHIAYADNADVTSPDAQNGGDPVIATSTDGTGGHVSDNGGSIETGDASASTTVNNGLNYNEVSPDSPCIEDDPIIGCPNSSGILATSTNDALLGSQASSTATTGQNVSDGGQATTTIKTGQANATANVINLANTNIFNSIGLILFINQLFGVGLDLRNFNLSYFFDGEAGTSPTVDANGQPQCTLLTCLNSSSEEIVNNNTANVSNTVLVRASTGENLASTTDEGGALITTGDAYAAANVVNVVNTNIINSSYLMVSFNNFGDLSGDITLPDADFFGKLFAHGGSAPEMNSSTYGANNTNDIDFIGTTTASAETGGNTASSTALGDGTVKTGKAYGVANTFTDANSTYIGGTSVFFLFRTWGAWTGTVKGLPEGMSWIQTPDGIVVMSDPGGTLPEAPNANCDEDAGPVSNCLNSSSILASSTNTATVENNVDVSAETGNNRAATEDGAAAVTTGDAYAVANVVNLINTNIVGRNWIFAVFNIFGDWDGNISFGKSELKLEAEAQASTPALPGSMVTYQFKVTNHGDGDAGDVVLKADFDKNLLAFVGDDGATDTTSGRLWSLGSIPHGQSRTYTYTARVGSVPPGTSMTIPLTATLRTDGADGNDGQSVLFTVASIDAAGPVVAAASQHGGGGGGGGNTKTKNVAKQADVPLTSAKNPDLTVNKTLTTSVSASGTTTVNYKVVVQNAKKAGPLYGAVLTDTLLDPLGAEVYTRSWALDTVAPADQITLTYSVEFVASSTAGAYRNVARVTGTQYSAQGPQITPVEGSATVQLGKGGVVLGATTDTASSCSAPLLSTYLKRGGANNQADVLKLQAFLNTHGSALPITGLFGPMTEMAVKNFQLAHAGEILAPLGLTQPTGSVYSMTQQQINKIACGGPLVVQAITPQFQASAPLYHAPVAPKAVAAPAAAPAVQTPAPQNGGIVGWFSSLFR